MHRTEVYGRRIWMVSIPIDYGLHSYRRGAAVCSICWRGSQGGCRPSARCRNLHHLDGERCRLTGQARDDRRYRSFADSCGSRVRHWSFRIRAYGGRIEYVQGWWTFFGRAAEHMRSARKETLLTHNMPMHSSETAVIGLEGGVGKVAGGLAGWRVGGTISKSVRWLESESGHVASEEYGRCARWAGWSVSCTVRLFSRAPLMTK